ncbi:VOC family protein [Phyllobacterium sp. 628]|uniref:VOC family protein n=1 Tax=Phyllobacterium sp. 628 TaxID=2718938 RepID=UPI001662726D|nr:VOC family protein [Phyllobacterium sp. 628]QND51665.1 VOC family protein [Phyllobacterium sp. 628]
MTKQKIRNCLWFDNQAEEAANFYVSIFKNSKVLDVFRPTKDGRVLTVTFVLDGVEYLALNGGPDFKFNAAVSLMIDCSSQEEVDYFWTSLLQGGEESHCGWLIDKYGLYWQVVPSRALELLQDPDAGRAKRAMDALLKMIKIDVAELEKAADGQ